MKVRDRGTDTSTSRRGTRRVSLRVLAVIPLAFALVALMAPAAWAHEGSATITCKKVTYVFADFPNMAGNTVHETIFEDGFKIDSQTYTFDGSTGSNVVTDKVVGSQYIQAEARWDTNGVSGHFEDSRALVGCGGIG